MDANDILYEYAQGLENPAYIIENYFSTFDKTQEGFVPFKLFPRQHDIVDAYEVHRRNLVAKPRQAGVSTTTAAYLAVKVGFADVKNPENILIIANKQAMAFEFLEKIKDFISQLPRWVWGEEFYGDEESEAKTIFLTDSKKELKLPNGCRVKAVATSKDALRGFTPTWFIMDEAAFIDDGDIVYGAAQPALGCLTKDSLILTNNGLVELDELVVEKDKLGFTKLDSPHMVCNKLGELTPATETFVSEYGETYKVKTKLGVELEGSWKHPLLVNRGGEDLWCRMSELRVGDSVKIGYNQNLFGDSGLFEWDYVAHGNSKPINIPTNLSNNLDFAYLLGLFVAEGNFESGGITITNKDPYIEEFLLNDYANLGRPFARYDDRHFMFNSKELVTWFDKFGLKKHNARLKEIPLPLLKMPKDVIVNFLQGMFDGDGMSTHKEIKYSSTSKKLAQTLQILLLNFGIISHVRKQVQRTSSSSIIPNKNHVCTMYNLFIYSDHAIKFYNEIGFRLDRKQKNIDKLLNRQQNSRYVNVKQDYIYQILKDNETIKRDVRFLERFWVSKYQRLSYSSLYRLIDRFPNEKRLVDLLSQVDYNSNYYWDTITSIEMSEDYTYDLHVPKTNSFISNGIISHNTGGHSILISTPNGSDPLYYKTHEQSKLGKNDFNIIEMRWYEDLRYNKGLRWLKGDEDKEEREFTFESYEKMVADGYKPTSPWYEDMCKALNNDARMIAQELDVSFVGSGNNVVDDEYIEYHNENCVKNPRFVEGPENEFWIWEEPVEGHKYILSCDVSRGDGEDYSVFTVLDFTSMEQVVEYQGKVQPDILAAYVFKYANLYNAYVVVDVIGVGVSTVLKLIELGCKNMHYDLATGSILKNTRLGAASDSTSKVPGLNVSKIRSAMVSHLEFSIREVVIKIRSKRITSELKTFVYKNGKPDHKKGSNDDTIMCLAMGLWVFEHHFKQLESSKKQDRAILNSWVTNTNQASQSFSDRYGKNTYNKDTFNTSDAYVNKNNQAFDGDNMWLFSGLK
jgi:intein/homing endonuclease